MNSRDDHTRGRKLSRRVSFVPGRYNVPWTEEEDAIVRRDYRGSWDSVEAIARKLDRSPIAVKGRAQWLGLQRRNRPRSWTEEEDERLRYLYVRYAPITVARRMGRSVNAVRNRAGRMGVLQTHREDWYTAQEVAEMLGRDHKWVRERIWRGRLKAEKHGEGGQANPWHISRRALKRFIRRYPEELEGRNVDMVALVEILAGLLQVR